MMSKLADLHASQTASVKELNESIYISVAHYIQSKESQQEASFDEVYDALGYSKEAVRDAIAEYMGCFDVRRTSNTSVMLSVTAKGDEQFRALVLKKKQA